ncbi:MAG: hypothetical protein NT002_00210 [candidate division Zixibacteria bacterium]|nr:hypothetical protein [candidate division Zixibacteria bacterium]
MSGPRDGAVVDAYSLGVNASSTHLAGPFTVDSLGNWSGKIPDTLTEPILLIASRGHYVSLTTYDTVTLDSKDQLCGFILYGNEATVSPLTHTLYMAATELMRDGTTPENALYLVLAEASSKLSFNPATTVPSQSADGDESQKMYAALLGGMTNLLTSNPNLIGLAEATSFDLMKALSEDLSDGALDGMSANGYPVLVDPDGSGSTTVPFPILDQSGLGVLIAAANEYSISVPALIGITLPSIELIFDPPAVQLTHSFEHRCNGVESSGELGVWMFNQNVIPLRSDAIAHWAVPLCDPFGKLLEPINVIWVDYSARSAEEARDNVQAYLVANHFFQEPNSVSGIRHHSFPYYGAYKPNQLELQLPNDKTWVDFAWPSENNHGRIFPAFEAGKDEKFPVYYTLGAFSRESVWDPIHLLFHCFISFDMAQEALTGNLAGWNYEDIQNNWGNVMKPIQEGYYNTADHEGVAVLVRPNNDSSLIGNWNLTSVNGQSIPPGVYLRWTFTASTVTVTSDMDCVEVLTYSAAGGILTGLSVISREGSECGDDDGGGAIGPYTVVGNTLTVTITDPEIEPPTAVFVFTRVS